MDWASFFAVLIFWLVLNYIYYKMSWKTIVTIIVAYCIYNYEGSEYICKDITIRDESRGCCPKTPFILKKDGDDYVLAFHWQESQACFDRGFTGKFKARIVVGEQSGFEIASPVSSNKILTRILPIQIGITSVPYLWRGCIIRFRMEAEGYLTCKSDLEVETKMEKMVRVIKELFQDEI
jgi:hypothetical protein